MSIGTNIKEVQDTNLWKAVACKLIGCLAWCHFIPLSGIHAQEIQSEISKNPFREVRIEKPISIGNYFQFMDSLSLDLQAGLTYKITEHLIVHANPGLIRTLADTDYYRMMERDSFVYDQKELIVLRPGDLLAIPDSREAEAIQKALRGTWIDVNIPEYRMRIYRDSLLLYTFPIRVGQNRKRYLKTAGREVDLRTKTGNGIIVHHNRFPDFYNPVDGKQFFLTKRDDGNTTMMPQIPWIDTSINGIRHGQMIHPTTNPTTLEKAYSNGCIGLSEEASWIVYYHAPLGTRIKIHYSLLIKDNEGTIHKLPDIYGVTGNPTGARR